jgi:hypothetical protein
MVSIACGGGGTTSGTSSSGAGGSGGATSTSTATTGSGGSGGATTTSTSGTTTSSSGTGTTASGAGGGDPCTTATTVDYATCTGTSFFPDGTCLAGECATIPLETRVYKEWRTQIKAISGLDDATLDSRVKVAAISHTAGPDQVFVRIDYVVVIDWVRSRQADSPELGNFPLTTAPTDAEIKAAVTLGIESAEWTGLAAIGSIAPEPATQGAFDSCACNMKIDFCHIDFENVTGKLLVKGIAQIDPAQNKCVQAKVAVDAATLDACSATPCAIN